MERNSTVINSNNTSYNRVITNNNRNAQKRGKTGKGKLKLPYLEHARRIQATFGSAVADDPFSATEGRVGANNSSQDNSSCESNAQCGRMADCIRLAVNQPKRCWCVGDLQAPDPTTGECGSRNSHVPGHPYDINDHGVIHTGNIKDIVLPDDTNATSARFTNETSSVLQLPDGGHNSSTALPEILPPVVGSFVFIAIIIAVSLIYRRRYLSKKLGVDRNVDITLRNNDGAVLLDRMNNISKNPTYFCHSNNSTGKQHVKVVASEHLTLLEVVGEGAFGQVFRGDLFSPESESHKQVAVKVLKSGATREAKEDFDREVEIMASFDHDNILKLLCVVAQGTDGSPYMVFEYMEHGDLSELLRSNDPHFRDRGGKFISLNKNDLVDISVQIANGMSYLAAQRFIHRDLATRNCLVGSGLIVKISDFGMSRDIYTTDYYRIGGSRLLPVRWMSPEAIKYGRFTSESDIWAYGVALWEIFSFGKQPYCGHTNEEVINFLDQGILLQRPEDCPSTVYHVMLGCWKRDPSQRIVFDRLVMYLSDYRNRLVKMPHVHHQIQHTQRPPGSASNISKLPQSSDISDAVRCVKDEVVDSGCSPDGAGIPQKPEGGKPMNYLTLATDTASLDAGNLQDFDTQAPVNRSSDVSNLDKSSSNNTSTDKTPSSEATVHEKQNETGEDPVDPVSTPRPEDQNRHQAGAAVAGESAKLEPKKQSAKRMASFPLFIPKEKFCEIQIEEDNRTKEEKKRKRQIERGFGSRASLRYKVEPSESKKSNLSPASVLELCPQLTYTSQSPVALVHTWSGKFGRAAHQNSGHRAQKTNKVKDKTGFLDPTWSLKGQSVGVAGMSHHGLIEEGLDSCSALLQSQRETSAANEYSTPIKLNL